VSNSFGGPTQTNEPHYKGLASKGESGAARNPSYAEYDQDYHRRKGADVDQPHRIKYRRIDA